MREMKYSGVEWIEDIPAPWNMIRFKDKYKPTKEIAGESSTEYERLALTLGGVIKRPKDDSEGLQPKAFDGYQILRENDFIFKMIDLQNISTSRVGLSPYTGLVSPAYIRFQAKNKNQFNKYIYYYLLSMYYNCVFNSLGGNGVRSALNAFDIGTLMIPFPPEHEQMLIVEAIEHQTEKVDSLIANQEAQIKKLKAYKQSLITEVVTKGLDPTAPMKDSGVEWIGEIPAHWSIMPSKFLFANSDERRRDNDVQLTASQKYGMISQEEYMRRENARIVLADKGLENWKHIEPFDFVISLRSFQGGLEMSEVTGCATWHYIVLRARKELHPYYYKWLFKSTMYITALQRTCNYIRDGQDLRYSNFVKVSLCVPTLGEQVQIANYLDAKCAKIERLIAIKQAKIEKLEQYKKSLIYEYVTGKKEVVNG
ncbi:restriction endonuclease subunit S [Oscillibacter sp. MSJ-31]|uniref:restriction endonuclease subunit S n=1 Tax=Oscillibacter sp. MSJ-31 TaxID=2841526 RepID=UPI001C0F4F42|nr:restriction endonuclease subunit S [Oscillibacter sp. MSJ-31]MBU5456744.1 restriction endonuclease subunit S [Oscillibacter sp. MSJ-31]